MYFLCMYPCNTTCHVCMYAKLHAYHTLVLYMNVWPHVNSCNVHVDTCTCIIYINLKFVFFYF